MGNTVVLVLELWSALINLIAPKLACDSDPAVVIVIETLISSLSFDFILYLQYSGICHTL